jgi:hypothetical protein
MLLARVAGSTAIAHVVQCSSSVSSGDDLHSGILTICQVQSRQNTLSKVGQAALSFACFIVDALQGDVEGSDVVTETQIDIRECVCVSGIPNDGEFIDWNYCAGSTGGYSSAFAIYQQMIMVDTGYSQG